MKESRDKKRLENNTKWVAYDEVLDFLKWQFDDDFADQQMQLFHVVRGKINGNQRNRKNKSN